MKPEFALSLSFDGIRLLQRAAGGWRAVGEVAVSDPDLTGALQELRRSAGKVKTRRVRTKLIIPDNQIKYLTVDTGDVDDDARRAAAAKALDGATPYPVDALAFDISVDRAKTHVAAVARETLAEAEAFAVEHKFNPVSFVAAPNDAAFLGEPFFGETAAARNLLPDNARVEPDGVRVVVVTHDPQDTVEPSQDNAEVADDEAAEGEEKTAALDLPKEPRDKDDKAPPAQEPESTPVAEAQIPEPEPIIDADPADEPAPDPDDIEAPEPEDVEDTEPTLMGFATRRRPGASEGAAAPLGGVTRTPPTNRPKPRLTPTPRDGAAPPPDAPKLSPQVAAVESLRAAPPTEDVPAAAEAPAAPAAAASGGFLSRRKSKRKEPAPPARPASARAARTPAAVAATPAGQPDSEAERMTVFGARTEAQVGGKPRFLGLILTAILLVFLAGVAAWASVFLDDGLAKLFPGRERTLASTLPDETKADLARDVGATVDLEPEEDTGDEMIVATLNEGLSNGLTPEDAAVLDALRDPLPDPAAPEELDSAALEARYAVTGIWPKAPDIPPDPSGLIQLEDLYVTGIDPVSPALDAIALPGAPSFLTDVALPEPAAPPPPGTNFVLGPDGRVVPTEEGAISPDGFTVFAGRPPILPPENELRSEDDEAPALSTVERNVLAAERPRLRPTDLVEQNERATLGGLSRSELALLRPRLRPVAPQEVLDAEEAEAAETADPDTPAEISPLAAAQSLRPEARPRNFERTVARATRAAAAQPRQTAAIAPRTVTPAIPSSASVTREATVRNAINLGRVNLIGVYGTPSNRRALVRLKNGRYQKVKVGDRFDGGRISAIGDSELRYQKGARNLVLKMPSG